MPCAMCVWCVCAVYCVEVCLYLDVLFGVWLLDGDYYDESAALFAGLVAQLSSLNRRSVDLFSAKIFYYYALSHEKWEDAERTAGDATAPASAPASASASAPSSLPSPPSSSPPLLSSLLPVLLSSYRTACLQHNEPGQAVLINCILRIHLLQHDYALADTFRLKSSYPRDLRLISSAVYARYSYYVGKILCIQLAYSDAFNSLQQARRKAPQHKAQAADFKYHINLLAILTQLLMGEIPERTTFNDNTSQQQQLATITALTRANSINLSRPHPAPPLALSTTTATTSTTPSAPSSLPSTSSPPSPSSSASAPSPSSSLSLYPYLCLTRAVRVGDLSTFHSVTSKYAQLFARDDVSSLILRLRHNVIKAGLRKINVAYSAIPMAGISQKLSLESTFSADGESLVVKAISDGVIDATLDPRTSALHSKPLTPSYASSQPQAAFHRRIAFALDIHSEAVKALTYPATHSRAALHDAYEDDDDDEDSLAALQRKEKKDKDKQQGGGAEDKDKKEAQDKSKDKH